MKVKASPDPTPETPPFVAPFPGQTPSPNRKIVRRLVRRVVSASKDGVEVVIVDGKRMRRVVRRVGDAPSSGGGRSRRWTNSMTLNAWPSGLCKTLALQQAS